MRMREATRIARKFCKCHRISLFLDWWQCHDDEGAYADGTIWIGKCSSPRLFCVIFCHELGHFLDDRGCVGRREWMRCSKLTGELTAWGRVPELMHGVFGIRLDDSSAEYIGSRIASYQNPTTRRENERQRG